ncbi:hypothetical protein AAXE64_26940 [Priestia megaterium]
MKKLQIKQIQEKPLQEVIMELIVRQLLNEYKKQKGADTNGKEI